MQTLQYQWISGYKKKRKKKKKEKADLAPHLSHT